MPTTKADPKKDLDSYRASSGEFRVVDVPPLRYLMIDGSGDPNTAHEYADALATLYPVAYACKFASKRELNSDYVVPPLEALWWAEDMAAFTSARDKTQWSWTTMLLLPDWVTAEVCEAAIEKAGAKGLPRLNDLRVETLVEGTCVQTLHVGAYDDEGPVLATMHNRFLPEHGLRPIGKHHEIYLSDPRRTAPARLRTILRQPVEAC